MFCNCVAGMGNPRFEVKIMSIDSLSEWRIIVIVSDEYQPNRYHQCSKSND